MKLLGHFDNMPSPLPPVQKWKDWMCWHWPGDMSVLDTRAAWGVKNLHSLNVKVSKSLITDSIAGSSEHPVAVWRSDTGISNTAHVFGRIDKAEIHGAWSFQIMKIEEMNDYWHKPGAWCLKSTVNTEALRLEFAFSKKVVWGLGDTGHIYVSIWRKLLDWHLPTVVRKSQAQNAVRIPRKCKGIDLNSLVTNMCPSDGHINCPNNTPEWTIFGIIPGIST